MFNFNNVRNPNLARKGVYWFIAAAFCAVAYVLLQGHSVLQNMLFFLGGLLGVIGYLNWSRRNVDMEEEVPLQTPEQQIRELARSPSWAVHELNKMTFASRRQDGDLPIEEAEALIHQLLKWQGLAVPTDWDDDQIMGVVNKVKVALRLHPE